MSEILRFKDHLHDMKNSKSTERRINRLCKYGTGTVLHLGAKRWDTLPETIKKS